MAILDLLNLDLENKIHKLAAYTIGISTAMGALYFSLLALIPPFPLFGAWLLLSLSFGLVLSFDRWQKSDALPLPENLTLDPVAKYLSFGIIFLLGLVFAFSPVGAQIVFGTLASFALSAFFITQCIITPQQALNDKLKALSETLRNVNNQEERDRLEEHIRELLARGAEPLNGKYEKIPPLSILNELTAFGGEAFLHPMRNWYNALKPLFHDRSIEHRIAFTDASQALFDATIKILTATFNKAILFLQHQTYADEPSQPQAKNDASDKEEEKKEEIGEKEKTLLLSDVRLGANDERSGPDVDPSSQKKTALPRR